MSTTFFIIIIVPLMTLLGLMFRTKSMRGLFLATHATLTIAFGIVMWAIAITESKRGNPAFPKWDTSSIWDLFPKLDVWLGSFIGALFFTLMFMLYIWNARRGGF